MKLQGSSNAGQMEGENLENLVAQDASGYPAGDVGSSPTPCSLHRSVVL